MIVNMDDHFKKKIKTLYEQKKYNELINLVEKNIIEENRPAGLINILGIAKFYKDNLTNKDIFEALSCFEQAFIKGQNSIHGLNAIMNLIKLGIKSSNVFNNLSIFVKKAADHYNIAEKFFDDKEEFLSAGFTLYSYLLDYKKQKEILNKILNSNINSKFLRGISLFHNNYYYDWKQEDHLIYAKENSKYFKKYKTKNLNEIDYKSNKKTKLGFVSCDLERNHSTTFFLKDTLKYLDKEKFEIYIFSLAQKNKNDLSQNELRSLYNNWFDVYDYSNQKLIDLIQKEKINIVIDLIGYTKPERLEIFNSRIAPKQVSWLAYCNTTGFDNIDYLIADNNLIYNSEEHLYSEKILRLPDIWNSHSGFKKKRVFNQLPLLSKKYFTFGSLNNFRKISEDVVHAWSKILLRVENSKLILKSSTPCDKDSLLNKFKKYNVHEKIEILDKSNFFNKEDHLNLYREIDFCLDTFPYNGVTTTFEALWMNVPVLVLRGYNFNSRCGESIIKNLKLSNLISDNLDDYVNKAVDLAKNKEQLSETREHIFNNLSNTPLFNTKEFSKNFGKALLSI